LYLHYVEQKEMAEEGERIRKRNERWAKNAANATDKPCPALGAIADVMSEDERR
jgi:hypothetical protein